jgi:hypothetical protein
MAARLQRRNGERARKSEEKIGKHGVVMIIKENDERGLYFKGWIEEMPPLHAFQVSLPKKGGSLKGWGGGTMREKNSH